MLFLVNVYNSFKFCPSLLETVGICVPIRNVRELPLFTAAFLHKSCPSARCASAAHVIFKDTDIFRKQVVTLNHILKLILW
jgi:hypothetical protein